MAIYTPLSLEQAREICARYDLDVVAVTPLVAGSVNSNFSLTVRRRGDFERGERGDCDEPGAVGAVGAVGELSELGDVGELGEHKVFLRVYEEQDSCGAASEATLLRWLVAHQVPAAPPLAPNDARVAPAVSVAPASDGTISTAENVSIVTFHGQARGAVSVGAW